MTRPSTLTYIAKPRRGHVQVFEGRRLRYLVTGYFHLVNVGHVETLYGPLAEGRERSAIFKLASHAMSAATATATAA